ncbi:MAG: hypothetical protein QOI83_1864 [Streptomycetaceae bacterium]|nr:hypothetical protein [Streptomycetaceae bacterium]
MTVYGYGAEAPHDPHTDVGAYVLGVLDDADMFRFEPDRVARARRAASTRTATPRD